MAFEGPIQAAPATPAMQVTPAAPAAAPAQPEQDYTEIINQITAVPEIASVIDGTNAAAFAPASTFGEQAGQLVGFLDQVVAPKLGMDVEVTSKSGSVVFFNPAKITFEDIEKADAEDNLASVGVPVGMGAPASPEAAPAAPGAAQAAVSSAVAGGSPLQATPAQAAVINGQPPVKRVNPAAGVVNALTKRAVA